MSSKFSYKCKAYRHLFTRVDSRSSIYNCLKRGRTSPVPMLRSLFHARDATAPELRAAASGQQGLTTLNKRVRPRMAVICPIFEPRAHMRLLLLMSWPPSPNQVLTHAARAAAKQLNKHLFLATNMSVRARATARRNNRIHASQTNSI